MVHEIDIWPDFNELAPEQQQALRNYYALSFTDQQGIWWAAEEHRKRVEKVMNALHDRNQQEGQ